MNCLKFAKPLLTNRRENNMNTFANTPRYIACPEYDDDKIWWVIDMQENTSMGTFESKEEAVAEVRKLNSKGLN